ncbi:MAG: Hpt domain-containing protein, partial [Treponema sp.]|nr:Hpt domain-containing protein [Treponema sp.]
SKPIIKPELNRVLKKWIPADKIIVPFSQSVPAEKAVAKKAADEKESDEKVSDEKFDVFWNAINRIDGLSAEIGLGRVSGQKDVYEKSLKLLSREIAKCNKNLPDFMAADDMRNFTIEVHSMKGSLANIGAMVLSDKAKELEMASDTGDKDFCLANLPFFLMELAVFDGKINEAFNLSKPDAGPIEIPPELPEIFRQMMKAFNEINFLAINESLDSLDAMNVSGALKEEIEQIKDAVLVMDYDGASVIMQRLMNNI